MKTRTITLEIEFDDDDDELDGELDEPELQGWAPGFLRVRMHTKREAADWTRSRDVDGR